MLELETERLLVRAFMAQDWPDLYEYLSDPMVVKFEPYDVYTQEQCRQEAAKRSTDESFLAVCLKSTGKVIGNVYFHRMEPERFGTGELGYVFNAQYQGRGYASESCAAVVDHAFAELHTRRVIARCDPKNEASWRLLERLRFRREGCLIQNVWFNCDDGGKPVWMDTYEYAILAEEWAALQ